MINIIDHIKLLFRKDKELYSSLYAILGFFPHDIALYKQALSHSSSAMLAENGKKLNNERLEFLGDAIIEAVTSDIVYHHFAQKREGFLTTTRSKLVQRNTLNHLAEELGLDKLVHTDGHNPSHNTSIGGNAFEALVGAIYLDRGYSHCMWFLRSRIIAEHLNLDKVARKEVNFKSKLLEWSQKNKLKAVFVDTDTPPKAGQPATFHSALEIEGVVCGMGNGHSKKESQQQAAKEALRRLRREKNSLDAILKSKEKRTATEEEIISLPPDTRAIDNETTPQRKRRRRNNSHPKREPETARREAVIGQQQATSTPGEKARAGRQARKDKVQDAVTKKTADKEDIIAEAEMKAFAKGEKSA